MLEQMDLGLRTDCDTMAILSTPHKMKKIGSKPENGNGASSYSPISSVWEGSDGDLLEAMFRFYSTIPPEPILDSTYNSGRFWKGSKRRVVSMDIDPQYKPTIVGDNRKMIGVPTSHYGVVVYDPPHVGPQGRDKSKKRFDVDFGATVECGKEQDWNLSYLYPPFLRQAKRVLKPRGILLAKITDMVNNHKLKWPHCDFMLWRRSWVYCLRPHYQNPKWTDGFKQMERSSSCEKEALFLDRVPQWGRLRTKDY